MEDEMGGTRGARGGREKCIHTLDRKPEWKDHSEDLAINKKILGRTLKK
jgi:hypothetical protein